MLAVTAFALSPVPSFRNWDPLPQGLFEDLFLDYSWERSAYSFSNS